MRLAPDDWPAAIADTDGAQLVVAGPGTGKTEFIVRRAAHLVTKLGIPGPAVIALSFSRRSAAGLRLGASPIASMSSTASSYCWSER